MRTFGIFDYVSRGGSRDASEVELDQVVVEVASIDDVMLTAEMITTALGTLHERKDWEVVIPLELLRQSEETQKVFHFVMLLIATISLIVGGSELPTSCWPPSPNERARSASAVRSARAGATWRCSF